MITTFVLTTLAAFAQALFSLLPSWGADDSVITSMGNWGTISGSANGFVPEDMAIICLGLLVVVKLFMLAWDGALFVYRLIPFNG